MWNNWNSSHHVKTDSWPIGPCTKRHFPRGLKWRHHTVPKPKMRLFFFVLFFNMVERPAITVLKPEGIWVQKIVPLDCQCMWFCSCAIDDAFTWTQMPSWWLMRFIIPLAISGQPRCVTTQGSETFAPSRNDSAMTSCHVTWGVRSPHYL
jgi:hypothetical protein